MHQVLTTAPASVATLPAVYDYATARRLPARHVRASAIVALFVVLGGVAAWEMRMRALGLHAGDLDDYDSHWAVERRALNAGPEDGIAAVGDSHIFFDTDLALFEDMAGRRPIQLALAGTNGRYFLRELADEPHFRGLAVVGMAVNSFFRDGEGGRGRTRRYWQSESFAQRSWHYLHLQLSYAFAFLDQAYTPVRLLRWTRMPERPGVRGPWSSPWKGYETSAHRQAFMWPRQETDPVMREAKQQAWMAGTPMAPPDEVIARVIRDAKRDVEAIRARGGEVVFICPPSTGPLLERERRLVPRAKTWDRLIAETGAVGIHWEDHPEMQGLELPEWSHLSRASATVFTRAYVREAIARVSWLRERVPAWRAARGDAVPAATPDTPN